MVFEADPRLREDLLLRHDIRDLASRPRVPLSLLNPQGTPLQQVKAAPKGPDELAPITKKRLQESCTRLELSTSGTKKMLVERLRAKLGSASADVPVIALLDLPLPDNTAPGAVSHSAAPSKKRPHDGEEGYSSVMPLQKRPRADQGESQIPDADDAAEADTSKDAEVANVTIVTNLPANWKSEKKGDGCVHYWQQDSEPSLRPPPNFVPLGGANEWKPLKRELALALLPTLCVHGDGDGFDIAEVGERRAASTRRNVLSRARLYLKGPGPRATVRSLKIHAASSNGSYHPDAPNGVAGAAYLQLRIVSSFTTGLVRTVRAAFSGGWLRLLCSCPAGASGRCAHAMALLLMVKEIQQFGNVRAEEAYSARYLKNIRR